MLRKKVTKQRLLVEAVDAKIKAQKVVIQKRNVECAAHATKKHEASITAARGRLDKLESTEAA